jgi:hypothetical protein
LAHFDDWNLGTYSMNDQIVQNFLKLGPMVESSVKPTWTESFSYPSTHLVVLVECFSMAPFTITPIVHEIGSL